MATAKADAPTPTGAHAARSNAAGKAGPLGALDPTSRVNVAELRKPFYASVGAGELAVEKLRETPGAYTRRVKDLRGSVREIPQQVRGSINELQEKAASLYAELAQRGERRLSHVRDVPVQAVGDESARSGGVAEKTPAATGRRLVRSAARPDAKPAETPAAAAE